MPDLTENSNNFPSTFSRASNQFTALSGTLTEYATDVPAFGDGGFSHMRPSTNYITYSDDLTNAAWAKTNCSAAAGAPTTILGRACTKLTDSGSGGGYAEYASITNKGNSNVTIYAKTASGTVSGKLEIRDSGANVTTENITITADESRFYVRASTSAWTSPIKVRITIDDAGGEVFCNLAQYEINSTGASDPIPTSGSTATRAASNCVHSVSGFPTNDFKVSFNFVWPFGSNTTRGGFNFGVSSGNTLRFDINPVYTNFVAGGVITQASYTALTEGQEYTVVATSSSTTGKTVTVNGAVGTNANTTDSGVFDAITYGTSADGGNSIYVAQMSNLKIEAL